MPKRFAAATDVSAEQTRLDIERMLMRYRATGFAYGTEGDKTMIAFRIGDRYIRYVLPLPKKENFIRTPERRIHRSPEAAHKAWEQASRQSWRALLLIIQAKLEAIAAGVTTLEDEFLAQTVMANSQTVSEWVQPQITKMYLTGTMPPLLPMLSKEDS